MKKEEIVMGLYAMRLQGKNRVAQERNNTVDRAVELINQLDEPQKPIIPKFVADYIEKWKYEGLATRTWFTFDYDDEDEHKVSKWLYDNDYEEQITREHLLIDAIRYGYEVEKEKKYYVAFEDINLLYVTRIEVYGENGKLNYNSESSTENAMKFTDKEKASSLAYFLGAIVVEITE